MRAPTPKRKAKQQHSIGERHENMPAAEPSMLHVTPRCRTKQKVFMSLSALFLPLLLIAAGVGFLLLVFDGENVLFVKYNQYRITQARDEQVVRKSNCHVFLGGLDPGQAPLKTLLLMLRLT